MAWKSGAPLTSLLLHINTLYSGQVRLLAHSMGNVVAGEALRTNSGLVHTYIAMQGAIAAHSYDASLANRDIPILIDSCTPNRYAYYWTNGAPSYFAQTLATNRSVNFFNSDDFALAKWRVNQNIKPDVGYSYVDVAGIEDRFYHDGSPLYFPTNTFELFSFVIEGRSFALGAQPSVAGRFATSLQVDLASSPYTFGAEHKGHSAQFRSTNMKRNQFWRTVLVRSLLKED